MQKTRRTAPRYLAGSFGVMFVAALLYWGAVLSMMQIVLSAERNSIRTVTEVQLPGSAPARVVQVTRPDSRMVEFGLPLTLFFAACVATAIGLGILITSTVAFAAEYDPLKHRSRRLAAT